MSERAKIHLGDIQCECLKRSMDCEKGGVVCDYRPICHAIKNEMPLVWDLSDPPRFNEAQMALLRALYASGVVKIVFGATNDLLRCLDTEFNMTAGLFWQRIGLPREEIDLAELLGKDEE